jgi:hypothetical protein
VSAKLTPGICITPPAKAGWQQRAGKPQPQITIHRTVSRLFFFPSLPLMRQQLNDTCMLKNLLKLYCIWTWDTLWCFFSFVLFWVFLVFSSLMRQWQNDFSDTISRIGGWGTKTKIIKTETLLHLNLEIYLIFNFYFTLFYFLYPLSVSLMPVQLTVVKYTISPCLSLKLFLFDCSFFYLFTCFSLFLWLLCLPSPLTLPF